MISPTRDSFANVAVLCYVLVALLDVILNLRSGDKVTVHLQLPALRFRPEVVWSYDKL